MMLKAYTRVNTFLVPDDKEALADIEKCKKDHAISTYITDRTARSIASWYAEGNPNLALLAKGKKFRIPDLREEVCEGNLPSDHEYALLHWLDVHEWMINPVVDRRPSPQEDVPKVQAQTQDQPVPAAQETPPPAV